MNDLTYQKALLIIFNIPLSMLCAYILDKFLGDPSWFPHPVIYIGKMITFVENKIRKVAKSEKQLKIYGLLLWLITVGTTFLVTLFLVKIAFSINFYFGFIIQTIIIWTGIARKTLKVEAEKVYHSVLDKKLQLARKQISYLVGRDTSRLNFNEIIRATVETVAENTVDGVTAPLFFAMLGGAPLMMAYKAINTLDSMVGYKNEKYENLGYFSAKIDDVANFIPARITLIGFIFGAAIKNYDYQEARRIAVRDHKNHKSPNAAWAEGAVAGALGVQLGGNSMYFGKLVEKDTIGDKNRELEAEDIKRTVLLMEKTSDVMLFLYIFSICVILMQIYKLSIW